MKKPQTHAVRLCISALVVTSALTACQKQKDPAAPQQQTPSITERAADLQKKTEEKLTIAAETAEAKADKVAEKTRETAVEAAEKVGAAVETAGDKATEVATEAAEKVGSAVETAGQQTRAAGEAIADKALSQPQPLPTKSGDARQ